MSKKSTRVVSFIMAFVFFISTVAVSLGVILLIRQQNDQTKKEEEMVKSLQDQAANPTASPTPTNTEEETVDPNQQQLAGTVLKDYQPTKPDGDQVTIIDLKEGDGAVVGENSTVTAHYTGAVALDGKIFQSSLDSGRPFTTQLGGVIKGWQEGMPGMKAGGTRRLIIPAAKAYGANPPSGSGIPVNADLVFDIQLISVQN